MRLMLFNVVLVYCSICVGFSACMSSMAVDLGSGFMKVAVIVPKIPMEIVLDGHGKRKTPTAIGFKNGDRVFGADAVHMASMHPTFVYENFPSVVGKHIDHPTVRLFRQRYPYHNITYEETSGQLLFHHPDGMSYTAEELVAMLLEYARDMSEQHTGAVIKTCVLTVSSFYSQTEKASFMRAARLAGLELHQLIDVNAAVALNFGIFRRSMFTESPQYFMFFDVGYLTTTATVVSYQMGKQQSGVSSQDPFLSIIGVGAVPDLGTSSLIHRVSNHFAELFSHSSGIPLATVRQNARAMSRLLKEATRVLLILSANTEAHATLEQLLDNADFRTQITREKIEALCEEEFIKLRKPFMDALVRSGIDVAVIQDIVLMGGGTRIPKVQEILMGLGQRTGLNKGLNNDEAAVMGAVYQAASHTPGFRVLPFGVKHYNPYPIGVDFKRAPQSHPGDDSSEPSSDIRRVLFPRGNPFPQKRAITFNRHTTDLTFYVNYVDLNDEEATYLGAINLTRITTEGVAKTLEKHPTSKLRGIQAHFTLDHSGLLTLTGVDCLMQPVATPEAEESNKDESAFQKLGNTISEFFGVGGQRKTKEASNPTDGVENATNITKSLNETDVNGNNTGNSTTENVNQTEKSKAVDENSFQKSVNKTKILKPFTERITFNVEVLYGPVPSAEDLKKSIEKLRKLREIQQARREREQMANELESSIFIIREHIDTPSYIVYSTEDERQRLSDMLSKALEWFEEQDTQTPKEVYEEKLLELRRIYIPIHSRVREAEQRPVAFEELNKTIAIARSTMIKLREVNDFMYKLHQSLTEKQKLMNQKEQEQISKFDPAMDRNTSAHPPSATPDDNETVSHSEGSVPETSIDSNNTVEDKPQPPFTPIFDENDVESLKKSVDDVLDWMNTSIKLLNDSVPHEMPPVLVEDIQRKHEQIKSKLLPLQSKFALFQAEMERAQQHQKPPTKPDQKQKKPKVREFSTDGAKSNTTFAEVHSPPEGASKSPPHSEL